MIPRRLFLKAGILGGACLGIAGWLARWHTVAPTSRTILGRLRNLSLTEFYVLQKLVGRIVATDEAAQVEEMALFVDRYLDHFDERSRDQFKKLLWLIENGSGLFGDVFPGRRFSAINITDQNRCLYGWQNSRWVFRRAGFQALRSLSFLAYYRNPATWPALGYVPLERPHGS